jgi:hypothetical protein
MAHWWPVEDVHFCQRCHHVQAISLSNGQNYQPRPCPFDGARMVRRTRRGSVLTDTHWRGMYA